MAKVLDFYALLKSVDKVTSTGQSVAWSINAIAEGGFAVIGCFESFEVLTGEVMRRYEDAVVPFGLRVRLNPGTSKAGGGSPYPCINVQVSGEFETITILRVNPAKAVEAAPKAGDAVMMAVLKEGQENGIRLVADLCDRKAKALAQSDVARAEIIAQLRHDILDFLRDYERTVEPDPNAFSKTCKACGKGLSSDTKDYCSHCEEDALKSGLCVCPLCINARKGVKTE